MPTRVTVRWAMARAGTRSRTTTARVLRIRIPPPGCAHGTSRHQQQLPHRPPSLQVAMRLCRLRKRVLLVHAHLQLAGADHGEEIAGALLELLAPGDVVRERRAGEEQRSFLRELDRIERWHRAAGGAEEGEAAS